jgi:hypothetical protein
VREALAAGELPEIMEQAVFYPPFPVQLSLVRLSTLRLFSPILDSELAKVNMPFPFRAQLFAQVMHNL